jgi:hypothetical protein
MKKIALVLLFCTAFALGAPLIAQAFSNESEYFCVTVSLEKIYPYRKGYILQYRQGVNRLGRVYIPNEWFTEAGGRGELITLPAGKNWPYLTIFYKSGEFSHLRLYVHRSKAHDTWGNVPSNVNIDDRFENVETIKLEF